MIKVENSIVKCVRGKSAAHYDYAPFGAVTAQRGTFAAANPWRFSSEYAEDDTATIYYNYRHYDPVMGRWMQRDPIGSVGRRRFNSVIYETDEGRDSIGDIKRDRHQTYSLFLGYAFVDNKFGVSDYLGLIGRYDPPPVYREGPLPCCPSQRIDCQARCSGYGSFSRSICDFNFLFMFRCRCLCKWTLHISAKSGFPGYSRDVDCTYVSPLGGRTRTVGYYNVPSYFKCPDYIELGCGL